MSPRTAPRRPRALPLLLLAPLVLTLPAAAQEPRARTLSRELTSYPRLASTASSRLAARWLARQLRAAGFEVELDERVVLLSLPRRLEVRGVVADASGERVLFHRVDAFDPDAAPAGDVPRYNAWSASGRAEGAVVDVGRGLRADYERLAADGVGVTGKVALARYGGAYRGVKAEMAQEHGCVGLLLFSDPEEDGPAKGAVWPGGPWKPAWAAQRGSISALARVPGDPSTPGWPSPAPGAEGRHAEAEAVAAALPRIPCLPIGSGEASALIAAGDAARVALALDVPREPRRIVNVVARLRGRGEGVVLAGNHRDAWVRGAQDAGSGTVSLLRAAERLGAAARGGWRPENDIVLGFWDAEEHGLIGSTEWAEANAERLRRDGIAYVNADAVVSGLRFGGSGAPGMLGVLRDALARVAAPDGEGTLLDQWTEGGTKEPDFGLPGSGSDYTVFLHHLALPVIDVSFGGSGSGQYHTAFDDFALMDRHLDPTWAGHETAGRLLAELLVLLANRGRGAFDDEEAARRLAAHAREAGEGWLPAARAARLARAFEAVAQAVATAARPAPVSFYAFLEAEDGLADRPWYRNRLWAPGLETGYAAETFPALRRAAERGEEALDAEVDALVDALEGLRRAWLGAEGVGASSTELGPGDGR